MDLFQLDPNYEDFFEASKEDAEEAYILVKKFVEDVSAYLDRQTAEKE